jgi:hypothetical protein
MLHNVHSSVYYFSDHVFVCSVFHSFYHVQKHITWKDRVSISTFNHLAVTVHLKTVHDDTVDLIYIGIVR